MEENNNKVNEPDYTNPDYVLNMLRKKKKEEAIDKSIENIFSGNDNGKTDEQGSKRAAASKKSVGNNKKTSHKGRKQRALNSSVIRGIIIGATATLIVIGGIKITKGVIDKINYHQDVKEAEAIVREATKKNMIENECAIMSEDKKFVVKDNSVAEYREKLNIDNPLELYSYYLVVNGDEFNDLVQATSNGVDYYVNTEQFLRENGYFNPNTGEPSITVWENYMESELVTSYRNGELSYTDKATEGRSKQ